MTSLPYVLIVLFALGDGTLATVQTSQSFNSPLSCSMRAFLENEASHDRTYVCVTLEDAEALTGGGKDIAVMRQAPQRGPIKSAR